MPVTIEPSLDESLSIVEGHFGHESRGVMEVLLSAHATHLITDIEAGIGVMIEGPSGAGKTTLLRCFYGLEGQFYRSDDLTSSSFVSHDASRSEDELEKIDLLPRIQHKTLVCPDMAKWFDAPEEQIREKWSVFARVLDGDGYTRDSGSHGERGYTGDFPFNFMGATTPIPPRGHRVMSHVGNRLLFAWVGGDDKSVRDEVEDVINGTEYSKKVDQSNKAVRHYLGEMWDQYGEYGSVEWSSDAPTDVLDGIVYLTKLVRYARAPVVDGEPQREGPKRLAAMLHDLARGHALLCGREKVQMEDLEVCTRVALSTMPHKRRGIVRALVNPDTDDVLETSDVVLHTGVSRPTARKRIKLMEALDLGYAGTGDDGRETNQVTLARGFAWPEVLPFL